MSVAQPDILLVLNDASGTTVTNDGTVATDAVVGQGTESTDWAWHKDAGSYDGYWESKTLHGANEAWIDMSGIALNSSATSLWIAVGFNISAYDTAGASQGFIVGRNNATNFKGGCGVLATNPAGAGDFDLLVKAGTLGSNYVSYNYTSPGLSFNTDYLLCAAIDRTTDSATQGKFLLDADGTIQKPATVNFQGNLWDSVGPYIGRTGSFTNYYSFQGNIYFFAEGRGVLLSDADMSSIIAGPKTAISGWPGVVSYTLMPQILC